MDVLVGERNSSCVAYRIYELLRVAALEMIYKNVLPPPFSNLAPFFLRV